MSAFDITGPLPSGTTVLEASAGTGKTFAIAALASRFIAEGRVLADRLLVITFSRVASHELRARVRERLGRSVEVLTAGLAGDLAALELDDLDEHLLDAPEVELAARRQRLEDALLDFDAATIMTIHEFCQSMLTGIGVLARQDPQAILVEDFDRMAGQISADLYLRRHANGHAPFPYSDTESRDHILRMGAHRLTSEAIHNIVAPIVPQGMAGDVGAQVLFAEESREEFSKRKRDQGIYSFDDQLGRLRDSLTGESGAAARQRLRDRFDVVLVDEFQDTDPVQWEILESTFHRHATIVLIGDPKQAIYWFRGADVRSYLRAVDKAGESATLSVNHRADAALVDSVQGLFDRVEVGPGIVLPQVSASHAERRIADLPDSPWLAPIRIRVIEADAELRVGDYRARIDADLVSQLQYLLSGEATLELDEERRPVRPSDVAILVRTNRRGRQLAARLPQAGIPVAFSGADSIFESDAACQWLALLTALEQPRRSNIRWAVLTDFLGGTFADLVSADEEIQAGWAATIHSWSRTLRRDGVSAVFGAIQADTDFAARVLARPTGERLMTDYRHLAQLLHEETAGRPATAGLVAWLTEAMDTATGPGERTRRLETDSQAVQILSIHKSKGLQFPFVFLPEAADLHSTQDVGGPLVFHDESGRRVVDLGGPEAPGRAERYILHRNEEDAESLRTLYVALTRAQCHVTTWWGPTKGNTASSALHRVLHHRRGPEASAPEASYPLEMHGSPAELDWLAEVGIRVETVTGEVPPAPRRSRQPSPELAARVWEREIDQTWRRTSYSGLTAAAHESPGAAHVLGVVDPVGVEPSSSLVTDEPATVGLSDEREASPTGLPGDEADPPDGSATLQQQPSPMAGLPAGAEFGTLVHAVFEEFDPFDAERAGILTERLTEKITQVLPRHPMDGVGAEALATAIGPCFRTSLGRLADGLRLADFPVGDRLCELDFEFALGGDPPATLRDVADLLESHLDTGHPLAGYPAMLRGPLVGPQILRGFLTGSIDAVLRVPGRDRFLVVDYKTNWLGGRADLTLADYAAQHLATAMMAAHYPLQAMLYAVALHRFLAQRLRGYDPATHLGGVLYLFVRGMAPGHSTGVFEWSPPADLVVSLSALLARGRRWRP